MSKISLKSSSSGTATFTIESPSTNTDRTLNLPDGSGALYNQSNILGTVSQSGGVPTGAIIERGSNANGEFVRFADGTQIVHMERSKTVTTSSPSFAAGFDSHTFPVAFSDRPSICASQTTAHGSLSARTANFGFSGAGAGLTATTTGDMAIYTSGIAFTSVSFRASIIAVGRWF